MAGKVVVPAKYAEELKKHAKLFEAHKRGKVPAIVITEDSARLQEMGIDFTLIAHVREKVLKKLSQEEKLKKQERVGMRG